MIAPRSWRKPAQAQTPPFGPLGEWRDPVIFDRLEAQIEADASQHVTRKRTRRKHVPSRLMVALEKDVEEFATGIRLRYPALMSKRGFLRKTHSVMDRQEAAKATNCHEHAAHSATGNAGRQAQASRLDQIAEVSIPGWAGLREPRRRRERNMLRNSVCRRKARRNALGS